MGPYSAFPSPGFPTALHCFLSALEWSSTGDGCIYLLHVASSSFIQLPHILWMHHHPHQVSRPVQRSPLRVFNALLMGPPQPPLHVIRLTLQLLLLVLRISAMLQVRLLRKGSRRNSLCLQTIDNSSTADHIGSIADHQGSVVDSSDAPHGYSKVAAPFSRALPRTQPFSMPLSWALPRVSVVPAQLSRALLEIPVVPASLSRTSLRVPAVPATYFRASLRVPAFLHRSSGRRRGFSWCFLQLLHGSKSSSLPLSRPPDRVPRGSFMLRHHRQAPDLRLCRSWLPTAVSAAASLLGSF
ncbi:hypothetical protein AMECASPLE_011950 [Ameca splendens]|uniref:Uncharacterized protein n=1 Tax=Ameca splendens TaxID=208324 RepID=A0ABV0YCR1_9TELE